MGHGLFLTGSQYYLIYSRLSFLYTYVNSFVVDYRVARIVVDLVCLFLRPSRYLLMMLCWGGVNDSSVCSARKRARNPSITASIGWANTSPHRKLLVLAAMYCWCDVLTLILVAGIIVVVILVFNRSQFHLAQNMVFQCQSLSYVAAHATLLGQ
jgi:hypothetical protein